ncbi:MAG: hypothetical protein KME04_00025 [Pleurocapsa minor GSE-CHR-MK-17-07R]|jgi:hypothetical protein|nr:hypothetical protein [Pleurocapsa minor GSE-CHR-MK 17-07R]
MSESQGDMHSMMQQYREIVGSYEKLDHEIDALLMNYGGASENMPAPELAKYRRMALQRDSLYNEMRAMEQILLNDNEFGDGT